MLPRNCASRVNYTKANQQHLNYIHEKFRIPHDINLISTVIHIAEHSTTAKTETASYSYSELVSDIGGALGLILGLSIVNMMEMVMKMGRKLVHKIKYGRTNYGRKASAIILGHPNPTSKRPSLWSFGAFTALPSGPPNDTNKNFTPSAGENTQVAINVPHSPD